ncbi:MAG: hypothetical protein FJW38_28695 [Acidobacteria bacterium]|nr:hypothetical protein [Acidobacteriota bacterium]
MKLRIQSGSIRLRLKQAEVRALSEGGEVREGCPTLPTPLTYALRPSAGESLAASNEDGRLTVHIPSAWLTGWEADSRVGFESNEGGLHLLVEKDWKCTNPADPKDNEDCFENPDPQCT